MALTRDTPRSPAIRQLKQISVPRAVHPVVIGEMSRSQDRIAIIGKEGPCDLIALESCRSDAEVR